MALTEEGTTEEGFFAAGADVAVAEGPSPPVPASDGPRALFTWDVARAFGAEYVAPVRDVLRMACIQVTIQALMWLSGPSHASFFSADFLLLLAYIVLGVLLYWLVMRRLVHVA